MQKMSGCLSAAQASTRSRRALRELTFQVASRIVRRSVPRSSREGVLGMLTGFRDFILRGNVVELAVAVVIGAAFGAVVASFTADILTPLLGIFGTSDFSQLTFQVGKATVKYGVFLNALIAFLLVAAAIYFFVILPLNSLEARRQ